LDNHAAEAYCLPISVRVFTKISVAFGQGGGTKTTAALEGELETGNVVLFFFFFCFWVVVISSYLFHIRLAGFLCPLSFEPGRVLSRGQV
jgi:hypothetical protein